MLYVQADDQKRAALQAEMKVTKDAKWYRRLKIIDLYPVKATA